MPSRPLARLLLAATVTAVVLAVPGVAGAHVEAEAEAATGALTTVTFSFRHGCDGAATTGLRIQLPDGTTEVSPEDPAGWTSTVTATELDWTGGSVPDGTPGTFVATMRIPGATGETVFLPTIQQCGESEEAWLDLSDDAEAPSAAPRIELVVTAEPPATTTTTAPSSPTTAETGPAGSTGSTGATVATGSTGSTPGTTVAPLDTSENATIGTIAFLITAVVAVAVIVGGVLVARRRSGGATT